MRLGLLNEMSAHSVVLLNCGRIIRLLRNPLIVKQGHSPASSCPLCAFFPHFIPASFLSFNTLPSLCLSSICTVIFYWSIIWNHNRCVTVEPCKHRLMKWAHSAVARPKGIIYCSTHDVLSSKSSGSVRCVCLYLMHCFNTLRWCTVMRITSQGF